MRGGSLAATLALLLAHGGCLEAGHEVGRGAIVDGELDGAHVEVGRLTLPNGTFCSTSLVAPRVAIAAKHCIEPATAPSDVTLHFGGQLVVATALFHEGPFSTDGSAPPQDFLALSLDRDVVGIVPATIRRAPLPRSFRGEGVLVVGFGKVSGADGAPSGERRSGYTQVESLDDETFRTRPSRNRPATTCQGDSGGAVYWGVELTGVISGTYGTCESANHVRVDRFAHLVDRAAARAARGGSGPESCRWAGDGVCDVPAFCEPGTDTADCANGCMWAHDGACDEPYVCARGSDTADCAAAREGCRWAYDGACDEPYLCAPGTDAKDCGATP